MTKELSSPRLRFKKDDGSDFPAWEQCKFGELVKRISGSALSSPENPGVEYDDINSGEGTLNKDVRLKVGTKKGQPFEPADLLYGKLRPYLKNILLPDFSGVAIGDFWVLRPAKYSSKFLFNLIQTPRFEEKANCSAGSKMPRADWKLVSNSIFAVPKDPREAERIGELFLSLNSTITLHQKKLEHFKKLKESLLQNMFPREGEIFPRLRFPEFADAWEQCKFGELVKRISGSALSSPENPGVEYDDINSGEGTLNKDVRLKVGTKKGQPFEPADLLYGKLRPYLKNILLPDFSGVAIGDFWVLRPAKYSSKFLFNLIQTPRFEEKANCSAGSKMPRADWKLVSNSIFAVPKDPREAERIGELFLSLNSTITLHQRELPHH